MQHSQFRYPYWPKPRLVLMLCLAGLSVLLIPDTITAQTTDSPALTNGLPPVPMSLPDVIDIALRQGPELQRARKRLEAAQGVEIQTRAIAIPKLAATGGYSAVQPSAVDSPPLLEGLPFTFNTDQNWRTQVKVVQSIYEGGRILSSLRAARLVRERSLLDYQVSVADTVLESQLAYYAVLLAEQQIRVEQAAIELLQRELTDATRRFDAGTVPRFNVLRAEVELANERPKLSRARNGLRIARNRLANVLGFNLATEDSLEVPIFLSGKLEAEPWTTPLSRALPLALKKRSELESLRKSRDLRKEEVVSARAGGRPSLQAFAGYDARNTIFSSDLSDNVHGWMTGVQMSWDLFDGGSTVGRVREAQARYELAGIDLDDAGRRIELEVRTAYSVFTEADEILKSQLKVMEQAEEALRLAAARNEAGTSTQLDVLSAQTALTDARTTQVQALHDYAVARARLERAVGANLPQMPGADNFSPQP
jgi:outer membrane protein